MAHDPARETMYITIKPTTNKSDKDDWLVNNVLLFKTGSSSAVAENANPKKGNDKWRHRRNNKVVCDDVDESFIGVVKENSSVIVTNENPLPSESEDDGKETVGDSPSETESAALPDWRKRVRAPKETSQGIVDTHTL